MVLILLDDSGFGQYSTFGGGIPAPTLDKLAAEGLKYNRFHTTALCSPTRAALITGRNHHSAATGVITEAATGYDGYTCVLPRRCGTIGQVLQQSGYTTAWIGKNHNTPAWETSAAGPFDRWTNGLLLPGRHLDRVEPNWLASWAVVRSPLAAANATFALNGAPNTRRVPAIILPLAGLSR